jgi:FkbM family methyltransferase
MFYVQIWEKLPTWLRADIRAAMAFCRRTIKGWNGVQVRVEGVEFTIPYKSGTEFRRACHFATYEPNFLQHFSSCARKAGVIYDIGAAIGTYSLLAAKLNTNAKVFAFEPQDNNHAALLRNVEFNKAENIKVLKLGLGDRSQILRFREIGKVEVAGIGTHMLNPIPSTSADGGVTVRRGDDLVAEGKLPPPNMIKIDVEGFEVRVIRGLRKTILTEIHPQLIEANGDQQADLDKIMASLSYRRTILRAPDEKPRGHRQFHMIYAPKVTE